MKQESSDPLPYVQVDRAVRPKAATLATILGVTYQHALGGLLEFWEACGDPRELERRIANGETEVLLTRQETAARLLVALGKPVDLEAAQCLGLVELRGDTARIRGMSRYLAPVKARLEFRKKGAAGGRASAAKRREATGSAQPVRSTPAQAEPEAAPKPARSRTPEQLQNGPKPPEATDSGQRTSDSSKEEERPSSVDKVLEELVPPLKALEAPIIRSTLGRPPPLPVEPEDPFASPEAFFAHVQNKRYALNFNTEKWPDSRALSAWWNAVGLKLGGNYHLLGPGLGRFGGNKHWATYNPPWPFPMFMKHWEDYVHQRTAA